MTDAPQGVVRPKGVPFDVAWEDRSPFRAGLIASEQTALDGLPGASVYHIDVQISDGLHALQGWQQVRYTNQEDVPLDAVYFRLFPNAAGAEMLVSSIEVDGHAVQPAYEFQDSALRVPLPSALPPGESTLFEMNFEVAIPHHLDASSMFGYTNGVLALEEFYPMVTVYDDEGWNVEVPSRGGDLTYFDASFYLVRVTAPSDLTVVASGLPAETQAVDGRSVQTFAAGPARDFYLAASKDFEVFSAQLGETEVHSYALSKRAPGAELALKVAVDALGSFNARFGTYPYTEFEVFSMPMPALGMEYPGVVGIALTLYDPDAEVSGLPAQVILESTLAHEVAHQWFYNTVGNDQVDEPWLDEALVQYATGLYYVDFYGEEVAQQYRASWWQRWDYVEQAAIPIGWPVQAYGQGEYSPIVYGRGPIFVTALAEEMGQKTFNAFLRDYYTTHKWGIGTGEAFRKLAEQHCKCDLSATFAEWVYGEAQ